MKELRDHRSEGAAGHNDGAFRSERSAGSDGNRRGKRLKNGELRLHAAAVDQNRFDGFRDAVTANAVRAESRHEADDQRATNRDEYRPDAEMITGGRNQLVIPTAEVKEIREQADQSQQHPGDAAGNDADHDGE